MKTPPRASPVPVHATSRRPMPSHGERVSTPRRAATDGAPAHGADVPAASASASISVLQSHSLPGLVQRELERMIVAGELVPGSKLNEAALAQSLGVSRGPVREAFRGLEASGLVRLERNRG